MIRYLILLVLAGGLATGATAGPLESRIPDWSARFRSGADEILSTVHLDTTRADSLPAGMPIVTKVLWGRHGLVRAAGLAPENRSGELRVRRRMLQWHQRMALVTMAAMTAQVVTGQLIYGNPDKHYTALQPIHRPLGYATFGLYTVTASLSLGAPPARMYRSGVSSIKIHRTLAIIHFAGMMAQPWLGRAAAGADSPEAYDRAIDRHLTVGWITYGAFVASALVVLLPL